MDATLALLIAIVEVDWRYRTSSILVPSITVAEIVALAIIFTGVLVALAARGGLAASALQEAFDTSRTSVLYLALLPCVAIAGVALGSVEGLHAVKDSMPAGVLLSMCMVIPAARGRLDRAELTLSSVGLGIAVLAVLQGIFGWPYINDLSRAISSKQGWDALGAVKNPVVGTFQHPNGLALFLVPVGALAAGRAIDAIRERSAWRVAVIHGACAASAMLAVFLGAAKMGTVTLVIGVAIRGFCEVTRIRCGPGRALVGLLLLVVLAAGAIAVSLRVAASKGLEVSTGTLMERWLLDLAAVRFVAEHPQVLVIGGAWKAFMGATQRGFQIHNEFLGQVLRFGLGGGVLFLGMFGSAFRGLDRRAWSYAVALGALATILLVEPADGAQPQAAIMTILGLCILRRRAVLSSTS